MKTELSTYDQYHRGLFTMHDKHERIAGLFDVHGDLPDDVFWPLFRAVISNSESIFLHGRQIRRMLTPDRLNSPERFVAMESHELDFIKRSSRRGVPVKVYRGGSVHNHTGFSWTTRIGVAGQFARLSASERPTVTVGRCPVDKIILYISGAESEIFAFPEDIDIEKIDDMKPESANSRAIRQQQIVIQAKGINALMNLTPAEYMLNSVEHGSLDKEVVVNHMVASRKFLDPLGFKSRVETIDTILNALETV